MADLAVGDVVVTVAVDRQRIGRFKAVKATVVFGDGSKTYPAGGVPMPALSSFTLDREIWQWNYLDEMSADGLTYKYDATNHKIRIFTGGTEHTGGSTVVTNNTTLVVRVWGR